MFDTILCLALVLVDAALAGYGCWLLARRYLR
jgi:hypothetical protein